MRCLKVKGSNKDFVYLSERLQDFQYQLLPVLKEKGYTLTKGLQDVVGYVLYIDNQPIGSIGLKSVSNEVCEIVRVFVSEKFRGNGYATLLFDKIESLARELGFKKAEMVAWCEAEQALGLYKKLGYTCSEEKLSEWYAGLKYVELYKNL